MKKTIAPMGRKEFIALMAFLSALNALAIDMILPAFPDIRASFNLLDSDSRMPLIVIVYFIGMASGQILHGPLADSFGRRRVVFFGGSIYILGALGVLFSPSLAMLIAFRFIQGLGAAAMRVLSVTIVRDQYKGREMAEIMSLVMIVFMLIPVIAPSLGQSMMLFFPWRSLFILFILAAIIVCSWVYFRLPETLRPENQKNFTIRNIINGFRFTLADRLAFGYTFVAGFVFGSFTFFLSSAEVLYEKVFHIHGFGFTLSFAGAASFMAVGNFANSRLVAKYGMRKISQTAMFAFITLSSILVFISLSYKGFPPFPLFFIPYATLLLFTALIFANTNTMAMENMGSVAGSAASVIGFTSTLFAAAVGAIISHFFMQAPTLTPVAFAFLICGCCAFAFMLWAEKFKLFKSSEAEMAG
ncbi:MAG: multidrug effflux MFS transporter [Alphaproteobacteria bacterium]